MGVVVQFDFEAFKAAYPEMSGLGATLATEYWNVATGMHANDGSGPINNAPRQQSLLFMLTAHIAALFAPRGPDGNPAASGASASDVVGRVTSASEGSVSVSTEAMTGFNTAQAQWLAQTRYGALYWASTAMFRTFNYRAPQPTVRWPAIRFPRR